MGILTEDVKKMFLLGDKDHGDDLNIFDEVMFDIDFEKLFDAMKSEIDPMHSNQVWTLVDPPEGVISIKCKMDLQKKIDTNN